MYLASSMKEAMDLAGIRDYEIILSVELYYVCNHK